MKMWSLHVMWFILLKTTCDAEKVQYISTEHPSVTYINPKYLSYANLTAKRYGRSDPFYYVGLNFYILCPFDNNLTLSFYFYEYLTNVYKRSFVEMHVHACDFIHKDKFFGSAFKQGKLDRPCPFPAGAYNLHNMTVPLKNTPSNFPFRKGRIYANFSSVDTKELVASGHVDMEIKEMYLKKKKTKNV